MTVSFKKIKSSFFTALQSGDYYMFEEQDDTLELDWFNKSRTDEFVEDSTEEKLVSKKKLLEVSTSNQSPLSKNRYSCLLR